MAALCGLKILLLWAGIIGLAKCSLTPQCDYTVTPIKYGFQISITSSTTGNYAINITEVGRPGKTFNHQHLDLEVSSYEVKFLKPCTEYEHHVAFVDGAGKKTHCNSSEDKTRTSEMNKADITDDSCIPGYVCYHSDWDVSTSLSTSDNIPAEPCKSNQTIFCIKPGFKDICSYLTTTFICGNSPFKLTKSISVDLLNPSEIIQTAPTKFPAEIETTLPPNCKNLAVDYTCQDDSIRQFDKFSLSELEPFTKYSCTGQIKENNVDIKKTTAIDFIIDCDLKINTKSSATNSSIDLSWNTTSDKCEAVLQNLPKLSYDCSCSSQEHGNGNGNGQTRPHSQNCSISGLEPYTNYTCEVQPTYDGRKVGQTGKVDEKTDIGIPDNIHKLIVDHPEHNVIKVTCEDIQRFKGPENKYIARLYKTSDLSKELKKQQNKTCHFEFRDLSYSTTYYVKVTAYNGKHESERPKSLNVDTYYNDIIASLRLILVIVFICGALAVVVYKTFNLRRRKSMNEVSEDLMLQPMAIYANDP